MKTLLRSRDAAYLRQNGNCFYCSCPMPLTNNLQDFARSHGLSIALSKQLLCTAEHLTAKSEGGRDTIDNIVAACWLCNHRRHQRKQPPEPIEYKELVRRRLKNGKWHVQPIFTRLLDSLQC